MTTPTPHLCRDWGLRASFPPAVLPNKWIVDQCITWTHGLEHSPSVGGKEAELEVVLRLWMDIPSLVTSTISPSLASHGHAIGSDVKRSVPSPVDLMVIEMIVVEVLAPVQHGIVPPVAPFAAAFVVFVQLGFVPSLSLDLVALPIAALEVWLGLGSLPMRVETLVLVMVGPMLVPVVVAV